MYFMLFTRVCQGSLPPKHCTSKTIHVHQHEIGREHDGPGQLPADIGPATRKATYEEYGIDHSQIGLGCGECHHERSHHSESKRSHLQCKGPGIRPETGTPEITYALYHRTSMWRLFQVSQMVTLSQPCDQDICNMLRLRCSNIFMRLDSMVTWQLFSRAQVFNFFSAS